MVASPKRGSSLSRGFGRSMMKVLLLLVLFAGLMAAAPTKSGICICSPAVKPKRDPTHPVASALKCVAKGSGGGDFADLSQPQRLGMGNRSSAGRGKGKPLVLATQNVQNMSEEKLGHLVERGFDIAALTELHGNGSDSKLAAELGGRRFIAWHPSRSRVQENESPSDQRA